MGVGGISLSELAMLDFCLEFFMEDLQFQSGAI